MRLNIAHALLLSQTHRPIWPATMVAEPEDVVISTEPLPQSALKLTVNVGAALTQRAFDATDGDAAAAVSNLLQETLPGKLAQQATTFRMIGQAQLLESAEAVLSRFVAGQALEVSLSVDVWPTLQLTPGICRGLRVTMRRPTFEDDKYEEALLELRRRYASFDGELPALDDALAEQVADGLTMDGLDALVRERVERESAIRDSSNAFRAAEDALLEQLPVIEIPETMLIERARQQFGAVLRTKQESATTDEDREALRQLMSWDAFQDYVEKERTSLTRSLQISVAFEAAVQAEELRIDQQTLQDNMDMYISERIRQGEDPARMMETKEDPAFRSGFEAQYVREVVLRHVLDHAVVEWS